MGVLCLSLLCCALLYNHIEVVELVGLLLLSYGYLVTVNVLLLFLVGLRVVTVV